MPLYYLVVGVAKAGRRYMASPIFLIALALFSIVAMHLLTALTYLVLNWVYEPENLPSVLQRVGKQYLEPLATRSGKDWMVIVYDVTELQLMIFPIGIKMMKYGLLRSIEHVEWQKERAKAALQSLRSRLSPHFIFNVLNSAVAELQDVSETAAGFVYQASDLIRFTLYEADKEFVPLGRELFYIRQLIELESMRTELRTEISYRLQGTVSDQHTVPTLLLLTLVENAFKHSVHATHLNSFVEVSGCVEKDELSFSVVNSVPVQAASSSAEQSIRTGIGLATIEKMLQLKYPDEHTFKIEKSDDTFSVLLKIPLNRYTAD